MEQENYDGEDRRSRERWKLKREVSLPDIVTLLFALGSLMVGYNSLDKRLAGVEIAAVTQATIDRRQDDEGIRNLARIDAQFASIGAKLDRLIERGNGK